MLSQRFEGMEHQIQDSVSSQKIETGIDLCSMNPTDKGFQFPDSMIRHELENFSLFQYNPDPKGMSSLRKLISEYYQSERNMDVSYDDFIITSSTSESYSYILKLLCNPGDDVLIPSPGYPLIEDLARMEFVNSLYYSQNYLSDNWIESLRSIITFKTKIIFIVSPSNPEGINISQSTWDLLIQICSEFKLSIVVDEVFFDYAKNNVDHSFIMNSNYEIPIFLLNGASKMLALPQLKLAWILSIGRVALSDPIQQNIVWIADTYLSVSSFSQEFFMKIFPWRKMIQNQIRNRISRNISIINSYIKNHSLLNWKEPTAGWSGVIEYKGTKFNSGLEWADFLKKEQYLSIYPGEFFHFQSGIQIILSLIVEEEQLDSGMKRLIHSIE